MFFVKNLICKFFVNNKNKKTTIKKNIYKNKKTAQTFENKEKMPKKRLSVQDEKKEKK